MKWLPAILLACAIGGAGCGGEVVVPSDGGPRDGSSADEASSSDGASTPDVAAGDDSGTEADAGSGADAGCGRYAAGSTGRVPASHRASGLACPAQRGPVSPTSACMCEGADGGACSCGSCSVDSDCTAGPNGRCGTVGPVFYFQCSYDQCSGDSDCEGGAPCDCRPSAASGLANACISGSNCRVDSDCAPGGYCSPSLVDELVTCLSTEGCDSGACYAGSTQVPCECGDACSHGYFCHTRADTCLDDTDCCNGSRCAYSSPNQRWECLQALPVP